ncbi:MAG: ABC transporter ATP-binding protein [Deinococcota bacterium]
MIDLAPSPPSSTTQPSSNAAEITSITGLVTGSAQRQSTATASSGEAATSEKHTAHKVVVSLDHLVKAYQTPAYPAVDGFSLDVQQGEMVALLGPSGCGKTTLLRLIAGFEVPDAGSIALGGQVVSGQVVSGQVQGKFTWVKPEKRRVGFVFQDYALFPHLTVLQNVLFGLHGFPKRKRRARAQEVIEVVGLNIFSQRYPHQLSGGQQQRVALARALAPKPTVMLLDEPFSNLDAALRESTRDEVRRILTSSQTTTILVTHDQEEAMTFADKLVVMRQGHLEQLGKPEEVYLQPHTAFVAQFLGNTNILRGQAQGKQVESSLGKLELSKPASGSVMVSVRPEDIDFVPAGHPQVDDAAPAKVISRNFKGHDLTFSCQLTQETSAERTVIVHTGPRCEVQPGDTVYLSSKRPAVLLESSSTKPSSSQT